ncbi:MAG TPA: anthranilate synthase component I family protein [Pyrinomonadaceae bacterium]|nr:anthranilate synthase component I family protein [Pyrinomonadaceae bacterium]
MQTVQPESFSAFLQQTEKGNVVPVTTTIAADLQTPFGIYLLLRENAAYSFLLESIEGGANLARFSFLGANPQKILRGRGGKTFIEENGAKTVSEQNLIENLRAHFAGKIFAGGFENAPLSGGAVGYFDFSAVGMFEPALRIDDADEGFWLFFRTVIAFDHARQQIKITTLIFTEDAQNLEKSYLNAVAQNEKLALLFQNTPTFPASTAIKKDSAVISNWKREDFLSAVSRIKEYILAGDCYQAVLSQRFSKETNASAISIYRALRSLNPSPYMFLFEFGEKSIVGASPEMLVRCRGGTVEYRPIAGTRRRGSSETEDAELAEEMKRDEKEVAEHLMLVDLGRNDLGKIAEYGTVTVEKLMNVEKYSHVQHLVSYLFANLKVCKDNFDALSACFPAGTVSGAPKVRAIEIIRELEPDARGIYAGAVGYADYAGNLDTCITIRTIVLENGVASVQAGAGIVADSVPEREFQETIDKAKALLRAIELAEG